MTNKLYLFRVFNENMANQCEWEPDNNPRKSWIFVVYDWDEDIHSEILGWSDVSRLCLGKEVCPTTGRKHLQCAVIFKKAHRLSACVKRVSCHWEPMIAKKDNGEAAFAYCRKEGDFQEIDNRNLKKTQGRRTDLDEVRDAVDDGQSLAEIAFKRGRSY